ncbi:hypothetical protein ACFV2D_06395 [Streptomyces capillispiralis]|uniref:hypothetical protein n=1 Tax=Streptomyces capillispiralis TaxID=68182 RepID=UPI0036B05358
MSESTVRRRRDELIGLLAAQAPRLDRALNEIARQGGEVVLIDGTLVRTQRRTGKADRRNYSGCEQEIAVSLQTRWLRFVASEGELWKVPSPTALCFDPEKWWKQQVKAAQDLDA